jgi:hypothetical protein
MKPRLNAGNLVNLGAGPGLHQLINGAAEGAGIAEQRCDVAKGDAGGRIVWNGPDRCRQTDSAVHHRLARHDNPPRLCQPCSSVRRLQDE